MTLLARGSESLQRALDELPRVDAAQKHGFIAADMNAHAALRAQVEAVANASAVSILVNNSGGLRAAAHMPPRSMISALPSTST